MIPIPYAQVVEFLDWLNKHRCISRAEGIARSTLKQLALEFFKSQGRIDRLTLSYLLHIFQICPMIREPNVREQMEHFVGCGECLHYIYENYKEDPPLIALHPLLEGFLQFCQKREWSKILESRECNFDRLQEEPENFGININHIGPDLMRAFREYLEIADLTLVRDYEVGHRDLRNISRKDVPSPEEGTISMGINETPQQAAERLVDSLYLLLDGSFYKEIKPEVYHFALSMGLLSKNTAEGIEFLSWLQEKHPKLDILGNIPTQEIPGLVLDFCEEKGYTNVKSFSREVMNWLRGDIERVVLKYLIKTGARAKQKGRRGNHSVSPLARYQTVPYHAMFLFLSAGDFPEFIRKYWEDLNYLTADWLDVYYSVEDLRRRMSGYEILKQLKSVRLQPMSLPALLIWKQSLSNCCVVPLERLSYDDIFDFMKLVVQLIYEGNDLQIICVQAQAYVQNKFHGVIPQIIIEQGEINMKKDETYISGVSISGVTGQVLLGSFNDVIANLSSAGQNELAKALKTAQKAIMANQELTEGQKQEQIEVIGKIGEEARKEKPNKTLLKSLSEGLISTLKTIPDVAKTVLTMTEILKKFYS